ncbi:TPA: hypothetical protein ACN35C_003382 [Vibrio parahaemolyticus]
MLTINNEYLLFSNQEEHQKNKVNNLINLFKNEDNSFIPKISTITLLAILEECLVRDRGGDDITKPQTIKASGCQSPFRYIPTRSKARTIKAIEGLSNHSMLSIEAYIAEDGTLQTTYYIKPNALELFFDMTSTNNSFSVVNLDELVEAGKNSNSLVFNLFMHNNYNAGKFYNITVMNDFLNTSATAKRTDQMKAIRRLFDTIGLNYEYKNNAYVVRVEGSKFEASHSDFKQKAMNEYKDFQCIKGIKGIKGSFRDQFKKPVKTEEKQKEATVKQEVKVKLKEEVKRQGLTENKEPALTGTYKQKVKTVLNAENLNDEYQVFLSSLLNNVENYKKYKRNALPKNIMERMPKQAYYDYFVELENGNHFENFQAKLNSKYNQLAYTS